MSYADIPCYLCIILSSSFTFLHPTIQNLCEIVIKRTFKNYENKRNYIDIHSDNLTIQEDHNFHDIAVIVFCNTHTTLNHGDIVRELGKFFGAIIFKYCSIYSSTIYSDKH